jgi:hypothetical protein
MVAQTFIMAASASPSPFPHPPSLHDRLASAGRAVHKPKLPRPLVVSEPCAGAGTVSVAMQNWSMGYEPVNLFEKLGGLEKLYSFMHGSVAMTFRLGPRDGDLMKKALVGLADSDGLIAGPPCPPWSNQGNRLGTSDCRASVYDRVVEWIVELACRGCLLWFAVENVPGILKKLETQGDRSYMEIVVGKLLREIPFFQVWHRLVTDADIGLQARERVWLLGLRKDVIKHGPLPSVMSTVGVPPTQLMQLLHPDMPNESGDELPTKTMAKNLCDYKAAIRTLVGKKSGEFRIAVFDVDRAFEKGWAPRVLFDRLPTLTTKNRYLFLLSVTDMDMSYGDMMFHRMLTVEERFAVQGHSPDLAQHVSLALGMKLTGNAFPVTMLERVLMPMLERVEASGVMCNDPAGHKLSTTALEALAASYSSIVEPEERKSTKRHFEFE